MAEEKTQNTSVKEKTQSLSVEDKARHIFEDRYQAIAKRLETETNIINRYELKLSLELILDLYKSIFQEN